MVAPTKRIPDLPAVSQIPLRESLRPAAVARRVLRRSLLKSFKTRCGANKIGMGWSGQPAVRRRQFIRQS
jgi:hypothetical protein